MRPLTRISTMSHQAIMREGTRRCDLRGIQTRSSANSCVLESFPDSAFVSGTRMGVELGDRRLFTDQFHRRTPQGRSLFSL